MPIEIRPQPGPQLKFLKSNANIAIIGGANDGGKTFSLLMHVCRHLNNPDFEAVFFRRVMPEITNAGGLWGEAQKIFRAYPKRENPKLQIQAPNGATITFSHMQHSSDRLSWDGSQIPGIYFDQLEAFEEDQFWHMVGRNRSTCGVRPYIRASCNPKQKSWLADFIQWWWDPETGYAIPERSGVLRWFVRDPESNTIHWADSPDALAEYNDPKTGERISAKSVTFIFASVYDNKIALKLDPGRLSNLLSLPIVERERRLRGNWKIEDYTGDGLFKPDWWKFLDPEVWNAVLARDKDGIIHPNAFKWQRGWDPAGGQTKGSDYSSGGLIGIERDGPRIVIADVVRGQWSPHTRNQMMASVAESDKAFEAIQFVWRSRTPDMNSSIVEAMKGQSLWLIPERGSKWFRAQPLAAQAEAGNVYLVKGDWNAPFIMEAAQFKDADSDEVRKDDQVDCVSLGYSQGLKRN